MCAIFGFLDYGHIVSNRMLKKLLRELSIAAECRGKDATGMSYVKHGKIVTFKKAKPAHKVKMYFPSGTAAVIGHTRFTTQGSEKHNYNNHPFEGNVNGHHFALAHNGVLYNDVKLRRELSLPDTRIETDSYIAVQLLEQQGAVDERSLQYMAETVEGNFVFTVLRDDNTLFLVKGDNPLTLVRFPLLGIYVYASTTEILTRAFTTANICSALEEIPVASGEIIRIDSNGNITRSSFNMPQYDNLFWRYFRSPMPDDETQENIHLLCQYYNADETQVQYLLDFGYDLDEIEAMLADGYFPYALHEIEQYFEI